jgi:hypothetical protein
MPEFKVTTYIKYTDVRFVTADDADEAGELAGNEICDEHHVVDLDLDAMNVEEVQATDAA